MKIVFVLMTILLSLTSVFAQNLVPNPSFEEYEQCPEIFDSVNPISEWINNWYSPSLGSPDYFNECCTTPPIEFGLDVPNNAIGYQYASDGSAYVGLFTAGDCSSGNSKNQLREYLQCRLIDTLQTDSTYRISFKLSLADSVACYTSSFGLLLTPEELLLNDNTNFNLTPQVSGSINLIESLNDWVLIDGIYASQGNECYLTIGNFNNNQNSGFEETGQNSFQASYVYVDAISIVLQSQVNLKEELDFSEINILTMSDGKIQIESKSGVSKIRMFSLDGKLLLNENYKSERIVILKPLCSAGIYLMVVETSSHTTFNEKIYID